MYKQVFRCRLCGEVYTGDDAQEYKDRGEFLWAHNSVVVAFHECFGGDIGIAEHIGYKAVSEVENG